MKVDQAALQTHARRYLLKVAHLDNVDLKLEGTAEFFGYSFVAFSFHLPEWGAFWLVRGEQGYGLYAQAEYETIPEAILEHFDSKGTDLESRLAAHFPAPLKKAKNAD